MSNLQDAHNQGEKDGSEDRCNPPHGQVAILVSTIAEGERMEAENEAYMQGFNNGYSQR